MIDTHDERTEIDAMTVKAYSPRGAASLGRSSLAGSPEAPRDDSQRMVIRVEAGKGRKDR